MNRCLLLLLLLLSPPGAAASPVLVQQARTALLVANAPSADAWWKPWAHRPDLTLMTRGSRAQALR